MVKLYYFQAPNFDINPDSNIAPKLGSIFSTLETLTAPLNQDEYVTIPSNLTNQSSYTNFNETTKQKLEAKAGSIDLIYAFARDKNNIYHCELLETFEFAPNKEFVSDCIIASHRVQSFLEHTFVGRKRVYMITGLKIASGFTKSTTNETQHNPRLKLGMKGMMIGSPKLGLTVANSQTVDHGRTLNKIVFAYRVIRIKIKRDGEADYSYKSGGKYAYDDDSDEDEDEEGRWDIEPLDEEDRLKDFPDSVKLEYEVDGDLGDGD